MTLQILVNHYREDIEIVERFLRSLEMQQDVEFSVLIASDGAEKLDSSFLSQFDLKLQYVYLPHAGVCATRNALMDNSDAEYIMFADIDDCFFTTDGLSLLMSKAEETHADIVASNYLAEGMHNKTYTYQQYARDKIRVHGKIFRREYLVENNIRFPDEMETSGDMMFLWLAFTLSSKTEWIAQCFYMWKHNPNSVTRHVEFENVYHYPRTVRCYTLLAQDLKKRNRWDLYQSLLSVLVPMLYFDSTSWVWQKAPKDFVLEANKAIKECLTWALSDYKTLSEKLRTTGYNTEHNAKKYCNPPEGQAGIASWAKRMLAGQESIVQSSDILIVGYGTVGSNLGKELNKLRPDIYDKYKNIDMRSGKYKVAFICVDTPKTEDSLCDISEVKNAILENDAEIYVIKSTILPGTTNEIIEETGKNVIFSPEYYGGTQHCNNYDFDFTILGGDRESCKKVIQILQKVYDGRHQFRITDSKTAELVKYMENSYLATKVSFCNQFYKIAKEADVSYEELRELFILDPRVNPSHTFVYEDKPYWDSHCLNKDVPAIAEEYDAGLLKSIITFNKECKDNK